MAIIHRLNKEMLEDFRKTLKKYFSFTSPDLTDDALEVAYTFWLFDKLEDINFIKTIKQLKSFNRGELKTLKAVFIKCSMDNLNKCIKAPSAKDRKHG